MKKSQKLAVSYRKSSAPDKPGILLTVCPENNFEGQIVGTGSSQEVDLKGMNALLVRGNWDDNFEEWLFDGTLDLRWNQDGLYYRFFALGGIVAEQELIDMAKSMQ
ncbi:MAG: hypothetical protein MUO76_01625 [Anaerolineaceae bacterium]|nr:hypothetical protein [Anaerolineaceae bacterium]